MRKILVSATASVLIAYGFFAFAGASDRDLVAHQETVNVDGDLDDWNLNTYSEDQYGVLDSSNIQFYPGIGSMKSDGDKDLSAKVYAAWDDDYIYIAAVVRDDSVERDGANPYENDGLTLWIDGAHDGGLSIEGTPDIDSAQIELNSDGFVAVYRALDTAGIAGKVICAGKDTATGYVVEAAIPYDILDALEDLEPKLDSVIGLAWSFNDNDGADWVLASPWEEKGLVLPDEYGDLILSGFTSVDFGMELPTTWGSIKINLTTLDPK
jgi:hypothetical protein